jgi:predicted nucleotidyltransferase
VEAIYEKLIQFLDNAAKELYEMASSGSPLWGLDDLEEEFLDKVVYRNKFMSNITHREELQGVQILTWRS